MYTISGTTVRQTRGDSFISEVEIYDQEGKAYTPQPTDTITYAMKKTYWDAKPLVTKSIDKETMLLQLDPEDTDELATGRYVYDIDIVMLGGVKDTFISGVWILEPEV